jgi:hypothetical protein
MNHIMRNGLYGCLVLLATPWLASAELAVCFDPARALGTQFFYQPTVDPSQVANPLCVVVTKASKQTAAQLALITSTIRGAPAPKYLKVVDGLAVVMTPAEQDAVDLDLATKAAAVQVFQEETTTQDLCSAATLAEVDTKIDAFMNAAVAAMTTDINAVASVATAKTALTTVAQQVSQQRIAYKKILRCLVAIKKGAR